MTITGTLTDDGTRTYHYDAENRLVRVVSPLGKESGFAYDGFGRRILQEEKSSFLSKLNPLLWCGASICRSVGVDDFIVRRYYPQGELRAGQRLYYARDHLGSVREVWDLDGNLARSAANFDPYGVRTGSYGEVRNHGYAGMWQHAPTGLNLTWYRAYRPSHGRWTRPDPIGEAGGVNLYGYVGGNPVNALDPLGLETQVIVVREYGIGAHAAVRVDNGGSPVLYDPAGSYIPNSGEPRGSGDIFYDRNANLQDYVKYHEKSGTVEVTRLPTTRAQESTIVRQAEDFGGASPFFCATAVSSALKGVCGIEGSFWPGKLSEQAKSATCP
jgi:RHS repeat-associated protein